MSQFDNTDPIARSSDANDLLQAEKEARAKAESNGRTCWKGQSGEIVNGVWVPEHAQSTAEPQPQGTAAEQAAEQSSVQRAYVDLCFDRSGSMQSMGNIPQEQLAELLRSQKDTAEDNGPEIYLSFTSFDSVATTYIDNKPVQEIPEPSEDTLREWLGPRHATLLIDTVLARAEALRARVKDYKDTLPEGERDALVTSTLYVLTDGMDNQSANSATALNRVMTAARKDKTINNTIFLAANQDAISSARAFGFDEGASMTIGHTPDDAWRGMRCASDMVREVSSGKKKRATFSEIERASATKDLLECSVAVSTRLAMSPPQAPRKNDMQLKRTKSEN